MYICVCKVKLILRGLSFVNFVFVIKLRYEKKQCCFSCKPIYHILFDFQVKTFANMIDFPSIVRNEIPMLKYLDAWLEM